MRIQNRSPFSKSGFQPKAKESDIYLYDEIGYWGIQAEEFVKELVAMDYAEINLHINSPGGNVFEGNAIYNALQMHPSKIITHVEGVAASMASVIALAGDEVRIAEGAYFMIHDPWSMVVGSAEDFRKEASVLDKIGDTLINAYEKKMNVDRDEIKQMMADESWFNADEAIENGLADMLTGESSQAAKFDMSVYNNVPNEIVGGDKPSRKELERLLRQSGLSRSEATAFVAGGHKSLNQGKPDDDLELAKQLASKLRG